MSDDHPLNPKEVRERGRKAAREGSLKFACADRVQDLGPWVDLALKAIGYPRAMMTDESCVSNFYGVEEWEEIKAKMFAALGFAIERQTYVVDVAERLRTFTMN